jgi:glycosyltransferase involved in cell wall biosynthesis
LVSRAHALLDAAELAVRLEWARLRASCAAFPLPAAVITDRGPLDGLAKFDPPPRSLAAAVFTWLGRRYDLLFLLDAPGSVLASRDGEHSGRELDRSRLRYRHWARSLPPGIRLDVGARSLGAVAAEAASAAANAAGPRGRPAQRVVLSSFDSPGNPHYNGGGAVVIETIARALARHFRVTILTAGGRARVETRDGVEYRQLPVGWAGPRAGQLLYHVLLPLAGRRIPHDLWIESFTPPFSTSFVPIFSRARVVGLAQSLSGEMMWRRYRIPFFLVERFGLRFYDDVVVLNAADRGRVLRSSPSARVRVIPNCVRQQPVDDRLLGLGEHILFLGRIQVCEKGLDLLLEAYEASKITMPLVIAGAGARGEERRFAALLTQTSGDIRWPGRVTGEEKQKLLQRSAFVVLPSRNEAFGLAALEGMSYGKPVVHFDLPTLRWMEGDVRVEPFDTAALARVMSGLASRESDRRELGRAAHAAASQFAEKQMAARYVTLAQEILRSGRPGESGNRVISHAGARQEAPHGQ